MTPERFRDCMDFLCFSNGQLSKLIGQPNDRNVRRWQAGQRDVLPEVAEWIEDLVRYFEAHPPPQIRNIAREVMDDDY